MQIIDHMYNNIKGKSEFEELEIRNFCYTPHMQDTSLNKLIDYGYVKKDNSNLFQLTEKSIELCNLFYELKTYINT